MIEIKTIKTKAEIGEFIDFRTELYRDDPCACPYLFSEEMADLYQGPKDAQPYWDYCEAEYYMAYKDGKAVGRIAAIINHRANKKWNHKNVRFGYFDFIDDYEVSEALIKKVEEYGLSKGMDTIIGPMGFIDLGREGMLIEGFDYEQTMHANHNFPYYREHMETLGFAKDNDWVQNMVKVPDAVPEKFVKIANLISTRYGLHAKKMTKKEAIELGLGHRLFEVLNKCYQDLYEFSEIDNALIERMVKSYISLADMNLVTLICDKNKDDEMVGFGVTFPSFTKALRKTDRGRIWPFGWIGLLKTLYTKWFHYAETVDLLIIGVLPEYRSKGANALLFNDLIPWYQKYHFKQALTLAMMETNDGVLSAWQYLDAKTVKRLRSYKKKLL
jgi:GNAT superfamily N-acetyltransferase